MKLRQGFVSNSSSSSFVCIGVEVSKNDISTMEIIEKVFGVSKQELIDGLNEYALQKYKASDDQEKEEILKNHAEYQMFDGIKDIMVRSGEDEDLPDDAHVIIKYLQMEDPLEGETNSATYLLTDLVSQMEKINEKIGNIGTIKIFAGTRSC